MQGGRVEGSGLVSWSRISRKPFLTPDRARRLSWAALISSVGIVVGILARTDHGYANGMPFGMDFSSFWAASRLFWAGYAWGAYVPAIHGLAELVVDPVGQYEAFFYPPPYLLFCLPFAALPFFGALAAFLGFTGAAYAAAIYRATSSSAAVAAALAFAPVLWNVIAGQNALLTTALIGWGLMLTETRPRLAGAILGCLVIKPHLALAIPIALIVSRRLTVLGFAAASAATLIVVSWGMFGTHAWMEFTVNMRLGRRVLEEGLVSFEKFQSAFAIARGLGISVAGGYAIQLSISVLAIGTLVGAQRRGVGAEVERSLVVLASVVCTPYLLPYDLVLLALPLAWQLIAWSRGGFPRGAKFALVSAYLLPVMQFVSPSIHWCVFGAAGLAVFIAAVEARRGVRLQMSGGGCRLDDIGSMAAARPS